MALVATTTLSFSAVLEDAALDQALQGSWCNAEDAGQSCQAYEEYRSGEVLGCRGGLGEEGKDSIAMRYTVQGHRICEMLVADTTVVSPSMQGERV
jgi:ribosomal protein S6E (S10)